MCIALRVKGRAELAGREVEDAGPKEGASQPVLRSQADREREYFHVSTRTWEIFANPDSTREERDRIMERNLALAMSCPNAPSISAVTLNRSLKKTMEASGRVLHAAAATPAVSGGSSTGAASKKVLMGSEQELIDFLAKAINELEQTGSARLTKGEPSCVTVRKNRMKRAAATNASAVEVRPTADNQKALAVKIKDIDDFLSKAIEELEETGARG